MPRQEKIGHRIFAYLSDSKTKPPQTKDRAITLISEYLEFDCWRFCKRSLLQYFGQFYSGLPLSPAPSPKKVEREPDEVPFPAWVAPRASATGSVEAVRFDRVEIQRPHRLHGTGYPPSVNPLCARSKNNNPGQSLVHWRLLTTHRVVCIEQALQMVYWGFTAMVTRPNTLPKYSIHTRN